MKRAAGSVLLFVTPHRVVRADFERTLRSFRMEPRPTGNSISESVLAALDLEGKPGGPVWVLIHDMFAQNVALNPAQIAGLSPDQIARALSFEVEPFSGIPVMESIVGYQRIGDGSFAVVEISRSDRDSIHRVVREGGGKLVGIAHTGPLPEEEEALARWLEDMAPRLQAGDLPFVAPPAREPSPNRFLVASLLLVAAAILILALAWQWNAQERKDLEKKNAEFTEVSRQLDAASKRTAELKAREAARKKDAEQLEYVAQRTHSVRALLKALAEKRPEEVVIRGLKAEGPSSVIVTGLSLDASSVDALSMALTKELRAFGWNAQTRSKTGQRNASSGGPWEFSLLLTHEEAARAPGVQLTSQNDAQ